MSAVDRCGVIVSHSLSHLKVYSITPPKYQRYRVLLVEPYETVPHYLSIQIASRASKYLYKPVEANIELRIRSSVFKNTIPLKLAYAVYPIAIFALPFFLANYEPNWQGLVAYVDYSNGEANIYSVALVVKRGSRIGVPRPTIFVAIVNDPQNKLSDRKEIDTLFKLVWRFTISTLRTYARSTIVVDTIQTPRRRFTILVRLLPKRELEYLEVRVPEAHDIITLKIPVRSPEWAPEDVPYKLRDDLTTIVIKPLAQSANYAPRGILITGPPGVGKTVTAEAIASALNLRIAEIRPSLYRSMWYGMTEKLLEHTLRTLKKRSDIMVLLDDVDFLLGRHVSIHETHVSEITILLRYLQEPQRPLIVMTTNAPELLDSAIIRPGRIDVVIVMGYPDREMRKAIAMKSAKRYGIELDEQILDTIVRITRWFTNAEIDALIRLAASKGDGKITEESLMWARQKFNINERWRKSLQEQLRWFGENFQGILIKYVPKESEVE